MRFYAYAFAASALVLGACGGGDNKAADTAAAASADTTAAMAPAPTTAAPAGAVGAAAPITGNTVEVKMVGDAQGYRFEPKDITLKAGDGIKFTMVSGGPHNVAFDATGMSDAARNQIDANMSDKMAPLSSNMKANPGESITVSFANVPAGTYNFNCTPHLAMGMKGTVTVQ